MEKVPYSKTCVKWLLSKDQKMVFKIDYRLMQVKSIAECSPLEHSAILSTFIKLPVVIKTFVLSIFEWWFYTGLTVYKILIRQLFQEHLELGLLTPACLSEYF